MMKALIEKLSEKGLLDDSAKEETKVNSNSFESINGVLNQVLQELGVALPPEIAAKEPPPEDVDKHSEAIHEAGTLLMKIDQEVHGMHTIQKMAKEACKLSTGYTLPQQHALRAKTEFMDKILIEKRQLVKSMLTDAANMLTKLRENI